MLPRWVTAGTSAALEWLYAFVEIFDTVRMQAQAWIDDTYLDNATGRALDQHAKDRGTSRRLNETDATLRQRLRTFEDMVTEPAVVAGVNNILAGAGFGPCAFVNLRRARAHYHVIGSSTAFMSRGYRMTNIARPWSYIIILPYPTTQAVADAVAEYLRQYGPAGFGAYVERRLSP